MKGSVAFRAPNWLGDAVMATVVPPAIKRARPDCRLTVLAAMHLADVYEGAPGVDEIVRVSPGEEVDAYRRGHYDSVLLGSNSFGAAWRAFRGRVRRRHGFATSRRGWLLARRLPGREYRRDRHQVENYRALAGLLGDPGGSESPHVTVQPAWREGAAREWPRTVALRIALQPGATYGPAKRWPPERFAEVARSLLAEGHSVFVLGGPGDREAVGRVCDGAPDARALSHAVSVGELAALLESADLLITNDTGPMHLAAAVGTRTLAVFGSTSPRWTRPWGEGHTVVEHPVPCAPCFQRTCRIGYGCLTGIETDRVARLARQMLPHSEVRS